MDSPVVRIEEGFVRGVKEVGCYAVEFFAFRGIPYGEPPVGPRRFQESVPVKPWTGRVLDGRKFGGKCGQINWFNGKILGGDDCLYLNVYSKDLGTKMPVVFVIHGGNFSLGSGDDYVNGPDFLVEEVVLVVINYRVGILGFLNLEIESAPGNQGLKDQVLALKWVQRNISSFGGDSSNVTIYGYSAGAASVHYLTLSPLAEGLFHKAILQSGVASMPWASVPISSMKESVIKIAGLLGFQSKDLARILEFLRTAQVEDILKAESSLSTWLISVNTFGPSVDSQAKVPFLTCSIDEALKRGIRVPCIIGVTTHEAIMQLAGLSDQNLAALEDQSLLFHPTTRQFLDRQDINLDVVQDFFMAGKKTSRQNIEKVVDLMSFIHFLANVQQVLEVQQQVDVPCWFFKFGYFSEDTAMVQKIMRTDLKGAAHCEDVGYLMNMKGYRKIGIEPPRQGTPEYDIQRRFIEFWSAFAKTGNPNPTTPKAITEPWPALDRHQIGFTCLQMSSSLTNSVEPNLLAKFRNLPP